MSPLHLVHREEYWPDRPGLLLFRSSARRGWDTRAQNAPFLRSYGCWGWTLVSRTEVLAMITHQEMGVGTQEM